MLTINLGFNSITTHLSAESGEVGLPEKNRKIDCWMKGTVDQNNQCIRQMGKIWFSDI